MHALNVYPCSVCLDWYATADAVAARALVGGSGNGWSNSATPQTHGGSGTTPRIGFVRGIGGAAGVRDPFVLVHSGHKTSWKQPQEQQPPQSVGIGARLCDALLFPHGPALASVDRDAGPTEPLIRKVDSPAKMPSVYKV